jgi:hypothetical protein
MSSIQNSKKFRERADLLQRQAALHGITMVPGEAAELLANRLTAVAEQMGISERWALDNYVTDAFVISLVNAIAQQAKTYREVVEQTEPLTLTIAETARVLAAIGMTLKLATEHADQTKANSMAVLTDGADAIVNIGAAMSADTDHIEIGGRTLVWIRSILVAAIDLLRDGQWTCPCKGTHGPNPTCTLVPGLTRDLSLVGGWRSPGPAET